jgi:hypothetical protein
MLGPIPCFLNEALRLIMQMARIPKVKTEGPQPLAEVIASQP